MRVNENSAATVDLEFYDDSRALAAPSSIRYKVEDLETQQSLIPWTSVPAASTVTFTIPATAQAIINNQRSLEKKALVVETTAANGSIHTEEEIYEVRNLGGVR